MEFELSYLGPVLTYGCSHDCDYVIFSRFLAFLELPSKQHWVQDVTWKTSMWGVKRAPGPPRAPCRIQESIL